MPSKTDSGFSVLGNGPGGSYTSRCMTNYLDASRTLTGCLRLSQPPIAVAFCDSIPAGIDPYRGRVAAGCRFWEEGAHAAFVTSVSDHQMCAIGVYTHNLEPSRAQETDLKDALQVFADLGYVRQQDVTSIPVLQSRPKYILYSPLEDTALPPDVVLLFVNAAQTLILAEATQQIENQSAPAMGRPACAVIPQVMNTGRAALSLGCCGARAYLELFNEGVALFAIPGARLSVYVERIEALAKANEILSSFHQIRRREVAAGLAPTVKESVAALA
jgi:uncharacterized protein (DUF169 family)